MNKLHSMKVLQGILHIMFLLFTFLLGAGLAEQSDCSRKEEPVVFLCKTPRVNQPVTEGAAHGSCRQQCWTHHPVLKLWLVAEVIPQPHCKLMVQACLLQIFPQKGDKVIHPLLVTFQFNFGVFVAGMVFRLLQTPPTLFCYSRPSIFFLQLHFPSLIFFLSCTVIISSLSSDLKPLFVLQKGL